MDNDKTETLWEHIETYDMSNTLLGKVKTYLVIGLYLGFFFIFLPFCVASPLAHGLGMPDATYVLYIVTVIVVYLAGKSIRFKSRSKVK